MLNTLDRQIVLSLFVSIFLVFEYFDTDIIGIKYSVSVHIKHTHFVIIQFMPINHKAITYSIIIALYLWRKYVHSKTQIIEEISGIINFKEVYIIVPHYKKFGRDETLKCIIWEFNPEEIVCYHSKHILLQYLDTFLARKCISRIHILYPNKWYSCSRIEGMKLLWD